MPRPALLLLAVLAACNSRPAHAAEGKPAKPLVCEEPAAVSPAPGNPAARQAAQRGLGFLATSSREWTERHNCFGCHVQAVTMEALTVGKHHQYEVRALDLEAMVRALKMGVTAGGRVTGAAFEGQAWARYDALVDAKHTDELLKYAEELIGHQAADGSIRDDDARLPITGGTMQTTYQGMQTWRQAYARTADDKWLAPMRRAERFLAAKASDWTPKSDVYLQNVNFALLGLVAAGVGNGEETSLRLQRILLARQNADGGWGLEAQKSDALATGQTLYALRLAGHGDGEAAVERGTAWLVRRQERDGAWRTVKSGQHGAEKGEAMWAVLGLVALDVTSVAVSGVVDGQHVRQELAIEVVATDNQAGGVAKVELYLDDRRVAGACAPRLAHTIPLAALAEGKHTIDVVATNTRGQVVRRRSEVYAGDHFLVELGTRFDEGRGATEIALRNLSDEQGVVELAIFEAAKRRPVHAAAQPATSGPMTFAWAGPRGRYVAEVTLRDGRGRARHKVETLFVQDSEAAQRARYGEVAGNLSLEGGGAGVSANTVVELVDRDGNVVQRVTSTEQGNYRFKNVEAGEYRVRTRKAGFADQEATVQAAPASAPAKADLTVK
jgi:hypothetical protein